MKKNNIYIQAIFILGIIVIGSLSGFLAFGDQKPLYLELKLPFYAPPTWLFAPVWTILYGILGYSLYRLVFVKEYFNHINNIIFISGLVLNFLWTYTFFGQNMIALALIQLLGMWIATLYLIVFTKDNTFKYLQVPYFLWLTFATMLNLGIVLLNI